VAGQNTCKATKDDGQQQDALFLLAGDKWDRFVLGFGLELLFCLELRTFWFAPFCRACQKNPP